MKAIENLMLKRGRFDYILLETTGLADPGEMHGLILHLQQAVKYGKKPAILILGQCMCIVLIREQSAKSYKTTVTGREFRHVTVTNVLPHRNAMLQTQDMIPYPVIEYRHGLNLSFCYPLNFKLEYTTTHF